MVGIDVNPEMIGIAKQRLEIYPDLSKSAILNFQIRDYQSDLPFGPFDATIGYDFLRHAEHEPIKFMRN